MNSNSKSPMQIGFWLKRINPKTDKLYTKDEAIQHIKSFRKTNIEYWIKHGFSIEEAEKNRNIFQKNAGNNGNKVLKQNPAMTPTHIEYWMKKGYSYEDAKIQLKNHQATFSLKKCIEKYGKVKGLTKFNTRQKKWQSTLNNKTNIEIKKINKQKNVFARFIGKNIVRDEAFFKELEQVCKKRKNVFIRDVDELKTYICNMFNSSALTQYKGINYFLNKICPKYLYQVLGISKTLVKKWLTNLIDDTKNSNAIYYVDAGKIHSYHTVADNNSILVSSHEIIFYKKLKALNIKIDEINKKYPNSNMRFDFKINGYFIEIAGLINDEQYKSKILYKREVYGSFILIDENEYDDFIQKVLIEKDNYAIKYYLTRAL